MKAKQAIMMDAMVMGVISSAIGFGGGGGGDGGLATGWGSGLGGSGSGCGECGGVGVFSSFSSSFGGVVGRCCCGIPFM